MITFINPITSNPVFIKALSSECAEFPYLKWDATPQKIAAIHDTFRIEGEISSRATHKVAANGQISKNWIGNPAFVYRDMAGYNNGQKIKEARRLAKERVHGS